MHAAAAVVRARTTEVAIHGVYEATKLLAAASSSSRTHMREMLNLLCNFLELSDAAVAFGKGGQTELIVANQRGKGVDPWLLWLTNEAVRRVGLTRMPWVMESQWSEPALHSGRAVCRETDLDKSFIAVPIKDAENICGVLCIARFHSFGDQADFCFDADVRVLSVVAHVIAACERSLRPARPLELAASDPSSLVRAGSAHVALESEHEPRAQDERVIGDHPRWRATVSRARAAARSHSTVLLRGESGTGKEILARIIHEASPRRERPFVAVNCAALSEGVLESELFGHEKGAFTGAFVRRKGRFEMAHGGTLFLDEIGEISGAFQARLLRVLQLGEFERVGGTSTLKVDVRVIAATNRNLEQEVRNGHFRADLYYRISVVPVHIPALRERPSDIAVLAHEFLRRFNHSNGTELRLMPSAIEALLAHPFPGNVRELENGISRAATLALTHTLTADDFAWLAQAMPLTETLSTSLTALPGHGELESELASAGAPGRDAVLPESAHPDEHGAESDTARDRLLAAMERAGWVQAKAARLLGLTPRQIAYALQKHQIPVRKF